MVSLSVFLFLFTTTSTCAELPQEIANIFLNAPIPFQAIPLSQDDSKTCDEPNFTKSLDKYLKILNFTALPPRKVYFHKLIEIMSEGDEKIRQFCEWEDIFVKEIGESFDLCVDPISLQKNQHLEKSEAMYYSLYFILFKVMCGQEDLETFLQSYDCLFVHPNKTMRAELKKCKDQEKQRLAENCTTAQQQPCCWTYQCWFACTTSVYKEGCGKDTGDLMCKVNKEAVKIAIHVDCKPSCTSPCSPPTPSGSGQCARIIWLLGIAHAILFSLKLL